MYKPTFFEGFGDLLIVLLYGAALSYINTYVGLIDMKSQLIASGILAFFLGSFGPNLGELMEWIIIFVFGIYLVQFYPQISTYLYNGQYSVREIIEVGFDTIPYTLKMISPWLMSFPLGYIFFKITNRNHYRHSRLY